MLADTTTSSAQATTVAGGQARRGMFRGALTALTIVGGLVLAAPSASAASALPGGFDSQLLSLVNSARANAGLGPLQHSSGLAGTASYWSNQLASGATGGALQHYSGAGAAAGKVGAHAWGENVGKWTVDGVSASDLFNTYMASPSHKANILGSSWKYVGIVSAANGDSIGFNTMEFSDTVAGAQAAAAPAVTPAAAAPKNTPAPKAAPVAAAPKVQPAAVAPKVAPASTTPAPVVPAASVAALSQARSEHWLDALYRSALGRSVDADAKAKGVAAIAGGASLASVAAPVLGSDEARAAFVNRAYTAAVGKAAEGSGKDLVDYLVWSKASAADVWAAVYSSPESFQALGAGNTEAWVRAAATKILGTEVDSAAVASWTTLAALGGRESVVRGLLFSLAGRANALTGTFQQFLGRSVDAGALADKVSSVFSADEAQLTLTLVTSTEFVNRANG